MVQEARRRRRGGRAAGRARDRQGDASRCRRPPPACWATSPRRTATPSRSAPCSARSRRAPARAAPRKACRSRLRRRRAPRRRAEARAAKPAPPPTRRSRRRCARSRPRTGVDPAKVDGSGKDGRVTKGDMLAAIEQRRGAADAGAADRGAVRAPSPADDAAREERVKMTRLRQTIARRLKEAQNTAAMLTTFNEVDMSAVMALRSQYKDQFEKRHGVKLGFMGFFVRACVAGAEGHSRRQRRDRRHRSGLQEPLRHRRRGRHREGPGGAGGARRRPQVAGRDREGHRRARPQGARRRAHDRGHAGRHLHHLQRRRLRLADVDADPQRAAVRHPRHAQDPGAADGRSAARSRCGR